MQNLNVHLGIGSELIGTLKFASPNLSIIKTKITGKQDWSRTMIHAQAPTKAQA